MIELTDPKIQKYLTPYRYEEPVLHGSGILGAFDEKAVDIPFVFWHRNKYYMLYTGFDGKGYQSALATSDDLLHWEHKGVILKRNLDSDRWDRIGGAATWMIKESDDFNQIPKLGKVDGKYWMVYHSYPSTGYENGPAEIGLAWTEDEELLDCTFRISLASPGKTVPTGKQADSIKPALSAIMTFGTCFIMQKTKKNAGRNRQVLQPQRIFFTGKDMKEIQ